MDLVEFLHRLREFSEDAYGPGKRTKGIVEHLRKEIDEVERDPWEVFEWVDVILLAFDGARRQGYTPEQIAGALETKFGLLADREWPDWRGMSEEEPGLAGYVRRRARTKPEYSEGVLHDGTAVLKDGEPMTITEILTALKECG